MNEREIPGFPAYSVSDNGVITSSHGKHKRVLAHRPDGVYDSVVLCGPNGRRSARIHRIVAEVFIPNPKNLPCVRHLDGNPRNNAVSNLAWGTYKDNEDDKHRHGTWDKRRNGGKLTQERANAIRVAAEMGWKHADIAAVHGVSRPTATRAISGRTWK